MAGPSDKLEHGLADPSQPALSAFGFSAAALIMTIFGFVWLGWGFSVSSAFTDFSSSRALPATRWITFYVAFLVLLATSIQAVRKSKVSMKASSATPDELRSRFGKPFRMVCFLEGAACAVVVSITLSFHRLDLMAAGISLVVGVHFLPLARLFRLRVYYMAGVAIILADLLSVSLMKGRNITLGPGASTGIILWITAIYALFNAREFLREVAAP
jgi:hypothetical protein